MDHQTRMDIALGMAGELARLNDRGEADAKLIEQFQQLDNFIGERVWRNGKGFLVWPPAVVDKAKHYPQKRRRPTDE